MKQLRTIGDSKSNKKNGSANIHMLLITIRKKSGLYGLYLIRELQQISTSRTVPISEPKKKEFNLD